MSAAGLFVTATDTGVGKTWFACSLLQKLLAKQQPLRVYKPVESGCVQNAKPCLPQDAQKLLQAAQAQQTLEQVCPYRLKAALSPARAASLENIALSIEDLAAVCQRSPNWFSLVEGAGGFYSPLAGKQLNADLAQMLELPVVVVVANRLGCISQTLLVLEAAQCRKLNILGVVLNTLPDTNKDDDESIASNAQELRELCTPPVLTTGRDAQQNNRALQQIIQALDT